MKIALFAILYLFLAFIPIALAGNQRDFEARRNLAESNAFVETLELLLSEKLSRNNIEEQDAKLLAKAVDKSSIAIKKALRIGALGFRTITDTMSEVLSIVVRTVGGGFHLLSIAIGKVAWTMKYSNNDTSSSNILTRLMAQQSQHLEDGASLANTVGESFLVVSETVETLSQGIGQLVEDSFGALEYLVSVANVGAAFVLQSSGKLPSAGVSHPREEAQTSPLVKIKSYLGQQLVNNFGKSPSSRLKPVDSRPIRLVGRAVLTSTYVPAVHTCPPAVHTNKEVESESFLPLKDPITNEASIARVHIPPPMSFANSSADNKAIFRDASSTYSYYFASMWVLNEAQQCFNKAVSLYQVGVAAVEQSVVYCHRVSDRFRQLTAKNPHEAYVWYFDLAVWKQMAVALASWMRRGYLSLIPRVWTAVFGVDVAHDTYSSSPTIAAHLLLAFLLLVAVSCVPFRSRLVHLFVTSLFCFGLLIYCIAMDVIYRDKLVRFTEVRSVNNYIFNERQLFGFDDSPLTTDGGPSDYYFDSTRLHWFNSLADSLWVTSQGGRLGGIGEMFSEESADVLKWELANIPPGVVNIQLKNFSLGSRAPVFRRVRMYPKLQHRCEEAASEASAWRHIDELVEKGLKRDLSMDDLNDSEDFHCESVVMDIDFGYDSHNFEVVLSLRQSDVRSILPEATLAASRLSMEGTVRLRLQLTHDYPYLGNATYSFLELPVWEVGSYSSFGGVDLSVVPGVHSWIITIANLLITQVTLPHAGRLDLRHILCDDCDEVVESMVWRLATLVRGVLQKAWNTTKGSVALASDVFHQTSRESFESEIGSEENIIRSNDNGAQVKVQT